MSSQQVSLRDILDKRDERLFCGRDAEIAQFDDLLSRTSKPTTIVAIYGIGGVGKSTLVRALARHAMSKSAFVAITSADNSASPMPILLELGSQIGRDNDTKKQFSDFFSKVERLRAIENHLRNRVQEDENTAGKVAVEAAKGGVGSAAGVVVGSALAGPAGAMAGGILGGALGPLVEGVGKALGKPFNFKGMSKNDAQFLAEAEKHLTHSFLVALNSLATHNKVVLLFDAIEYFGEATKWLRDEFLARLRHRGIIIVLAGRYALPRNQWFSWIPHLIEMELQPFPKRTTYEFLSRYGIAETQVKEYIHEQAAGLPLAVALLAAYAPRIALPVDWQQSHPETETSQVIETVTDSLLQSLPDDKLREAFRVCSIPRWFNAELLAQLLELKEAEKEYNLLFSLQPAIRFRPKGLSLHDTIREYLSKSLGLRSPNRYTALHQVARDYFGNLRKQLEATGNLYSEEWQTVTLEWMYHQLILGDISCFASEVERSSRFYQHTFARRLIADVETYQKVIQGITGVYAYHKGQNLVHHNDFLSAIEIFKSIPIQDQSDIQDNEFDGLVSYQLGKAYFWFGDTANAEICLGKALRYFESSNNLRMLSHAAIFLSKVSEVNGHLGQAIHWRLYAIRCIRLLLRRTENDDKRQRDFADRLFSLGEALRLKGSFAAALEVHLRCIEARKKLENEFDIGESYITVARCLMNLSRHNEAESNLRRAIAIYGTTNDEYMLADIRLLLGQQFLARANVSQAITEFREAARMAEASQHTRCLMEAKKLLQQTDT